VYVALLRGINVGGKHVLPMASLKQIFEQAGCTAVRTYIQSGNVIFESSGALARRLPDLVQEAIAAEHGFGAPVVIRSVTELTVIVHANPFLTVAEGSELHVSFLASRPTASRVAALDPHRSPPDEFAVIGREVYLRCPYGLARSKLNSAYFDSALGTVSTTRNWRTTCKLLELAGG